MKGFHEVSHLEGEHSKLRHFHEKSEDNTAVGDASSMDGSKYFKVLMVPTDIHVHLHT